jgi:signal transduction histidine kinase
MASFDPLAPDREGGGTAATPEELLGVIDLAPRFVVDTPERVAAAVCRDARDAFGAHAVALLRRLDAGHVVLEAREPSSTLLPPGRTYAIEDLPELAGALLEPATGLSFGAGAIRVPIAIGAEAVRLLVLRWPDDPPAFSPDALLVLRRFADQAGLALEYAHRRRAEADALTNTRQTHRLLAVSATLAVTRTVDEVAAALLAEGRVQTGADAAAVLVVDGASLAVLARDPPPGIGDEHVPLVAGPDGSPIADVLRRNEIVLLESPQARMQRFPNLQPRAGLPAHAAWASVPLTAGAAVVGAIEFSFAEEREFSAADREFLAALGRQGGLALERARLHAEDVRAREEAEVRASAAQALQYIAEGVFMVDNEDVVCVWNPATEAVTGLPARDAVGRTIARVLPAWGAFLERVPVASVEDGAAAPITLPFEAPGREAWISISGIRFDEGVVYAFRDVTGEHGLDRLKADFIATISHELRTPLAVLYGGALTLAREDLDLPADVRRGLLEMMASEGRRLERLVDRILFASGLENDTTHFDTRLFDAAAVVREVVGDLVETTPARIELTVAHDVEDRLVLGDRDHLRQVISNLIENAIKYSPDDSAVGVTVAATGNRVRVAVSDAGVGIAHADRELIFDKFFRVDSPLTRGVRGTGLGLYIVRELVTRMDGQVWVESNGETGSAFIVELPTEPPPT